jgi:hypothetical protein
MGGVGHGRLAVGAVAHVAGHTPLAGESTKVAMKPWSPSPCTVGAKRTTEGRTPTQRSERVNGAVASRALFGLARTSAAGDQAVVVGGGGGG